MKAQITVIAPTAHNLNNLYAFGMSATSTPAGYIAKRTFNTVAEAKAYLLCRAEVWCYNNYDVKLSELKAQIKRGYLTLDHITASIKPANQL